MSVIYRPRPVTGQTAVFGPSSPVTPRIIYVPTYLHVFKNILAKRLFYPNNRERFTLIVRHSSRQTLSFVLANVCVCRNEFCFCRNE